jgi:hypothetical protein
MNPELTDLEADLRALQATALDDELLLRLEAAADGSWSELSHEEIRLENLLRATQPSALPEDFLRRLEGVVAQTPFTVNEKIVLFPKAKHPPEPRKARPLWHAAAAVAILSAASALLLPSAKLAPETASQTRPAPPLVATPAVGNLVPASFNRGLKEVSDEGIVWKSSKQPHNVVRVSYEEKIILKDEAGRHYEVIQPRVQYMLVPAKTD